MYLIFEEWQQREGERRQRGEGKGGRKGGLGKRKREIIYW